MSKLLRFSVGALLAVLIAPSVQAGYTFEAINADNQNTPNSSPADITALEAGLYMDVTTGAGGQTPATFAIYNNASIDSSITDVYFDFGTAVANQVLYGNSSLALGPDSGSGVKFSLNATPSNLPGGNAPAYSFSSDLSADSTTPHLQQNGVNPGEWVSFVLTYPTGFNLLNALNNRTFRVGLHVQSIGTSGTSDSFIDFVPGGGGNNTAPEPGSLALLGMGSIGMLGGWLRKRRAAATA